jgi:hypothetical protein
VTRLDFPGQAFAASRIRRDVPIFRFSTQRLYTQTKFRLSIETILLSLNLTSISVELRKREPSSSGKTEMGRPGRFGASDFLMSVTACLQ